jgi:hypothetical protein
MSFFKVALPAINASAFYIFSPQNDLFREAA